MAGPYSAAGEGTSTIIDERVRLISEDRSHGAGWLARQAVEALAEAVEEGADPLESGRALAAARPSIGAIAGAVGRVLAAGRTNDHLLEQSRALIERRDHAARTIAVLLGPLVQGVVMTHSASATVREALLRGEPDRVVCTVSSPVEEGRPFAAELMAEGLAVDLVADDDAEHAVATADLLAARRRHGLRGRVARQQGRNGLARGRGEGGGRSRRGRVRDVQARAVHIRRGGARGLGRRGRARGDLRHDAAEVDHQYVTDEGIFEPDEIAALIDQTPYLRDGYELLRPGAR